MEELIPEKNEGEESFIDSKNLKSEIKKNPWVPISGVLAAIIIVMAIFMFTGITGNAISSSDAGTKMVDFLNSKTGGGVSLVDVEKQDSFYKINVLYQSQEIPVYMSKDGEYFIQGIEEIAITGDSILNSDAQQQTSVPKTAKPIVELFIMTHCPYGTQAEKGIFSVAEALGDKIDFNIRFIHYFMHDPEEAETPRQVCIREEQPTKWFAYLKCFLEDGDAERCLTQAKIDKIKLTKCIDGEKADTYYKEDSALSQGYGVQGSPTLIINGVQANAGRDSASYLAGICDSFTEAPEECNLQLSSTSPSPGFGWQETGSDTQAQC